MKRKDTQEINTASLPDIVFMLLFFFMTITVIRSNKTQLDISLPEVERLTKLNYNRDYGHVYVGEGSKRVQINDKFIDVEELEGAIRLVSGDVEEYKTKLYVDEDLAMRRVNEVKLEIRRSEKLKVEYVLLPE